MGAWKGNDMEINTLVLEGKKLEEVNDKQNLQEKYKLWCSKVKTYMKEADFDKRVTEKIKVKMHYVENEYSENDTIKSLKRALGDTIQSLEESALFSKEESYKKRDLLLVEKILENFYMYYHAMYKEPVHKRGTLTSDTLNAIGIGNEYDLQRMLYSILTPIFPTIRQEVYGDNGYGGMRADIYLDLYNLIIETKCTRESMSEKKLTEELGADGFHYRADSIYFFVCDKAQIIKNPEAFKKAFARNKKRDGKTVKVFILQIREF